MHVRMRQRKVGRRELQVVVHEDVDVDGAVVILSVYRLLRSAQFALYLLCRFEQFCGLQGGEQAHAHVHESVCRLKSPRLSLDERRLAVYRSSAFVEHLNGAAHCSLAIAEIGAERKIHLVHKCGLVVNDEQGVAVRTELESVLNGEVVSLHYEVVTAESACLHEEC